MRVTERALRFASVSISDRAAPPTPAAPSPERGESALDALDLDPRSSLTELVAALGEIASAGGARAELARRTFERLTERPEAHFDELLRTVPRPAPAPAPGSPGPLDALTLRELLPTLASRLGPEEDT